MLRANQITVAIRGKKLLDDVTVQFKPGQLNLIIGPNGAGKSTLVKVLSKHRLPEHGTVFYGDQNVASVDDRQLAKVRAVLSQNIDLAFPLKVSEVVMMGRYPHFQEVPSEKDYEAVAQAMECFEVSDLKDRDYMSLSGGEKQRVHFARVLAQVWFPTEGSNRFLILDEPLTFLDVYHQFQFMNKIKELLTATDLVAVGVVHDLNLAARFSDQIVLLHKGKVLAAGSKDAVLTKDNIKTAYQLEPTLQYIHGHLQLFF
jgi:iron complex transport system ATP-binding protein